MYNIKVLIKYNIKEINLSMDEKVIKNDEVVETAAQTANTEAEADASEQPIVMDLPTAITTVVARTEATAIIVAFINALLQSVQKKDPPMFSQDDLNALQAAVNAETSRTDALYAEIEKALAAKKAADSEDVAK